MEILLERSFRSFQCLKPYLESQHPILLRTIRKRSIKYHVGQRVQDGLKIKKMFMKCNKTTFSSNLKIDKTYLKHKQYSFPSFLPFFFQNTTNCSMTLKLD